ncbi:hypothetical protein EP331_00220 [bacterium]|nr:MAG: hypothetical protein EP331_00220 [bacterium]
MEKTIWKFQLETTDYQEIEMPYQSKILCVQVQNGTPNIWALVDPKSPLVKRAFDIFGTGHPVDYNVKREYIGTYQLHGGSLVLHVFGRADI